MSEFRFAYPLALLLLALPILLFALPGLRRFRPVPPAMTYSDVRLLDSLLVPWRVRLHGLPDLLRWVAWALLVVGLARPQTGMAREVLRGQGVDIVLALDISDSMAAQDFEPRNRLEAAKQVMADFIAARSFDRIGLVVFGVDAYHQAPLTLDYTVLNLLLNEVRLASELPDVDGGATAIGLGIASAANMLRESEAASRVIILLTDGDNNTALDPVVAAEAAAAFGIRLYTIGMGQRGLVEFTLEDGSTVALESDLNEDLLQELAAIGGGLYFYAQDLADLQAVYAQIDALERSTIELRVLVRWQDRGWPLLWAALALLLVERVLRRTVFQAIP